MSDKEISTNLNDDRTLEYPFKEATDGLYKRENAVMELFRTSFSAVNPLKDLSIFAKGAPVMKNKNLELMGFATLTNDSDEEQSLSTGEYSKTIESIWSTTTTNSRSFGTELEYKATIGPEWFKSELRVEFHMDFSYSESKTKSGSQSLNYKMVSQTIKVPPKSVRYVYAYLTKANAEGEVYLNLNIEGGYTSRGKSRDGKLLAKSGTLYDLVVEASKYTTLPELKALPNIKKVQYSGIAKYSLDAAFEINVKITDKPIENGEMANDGDILDEFTLYPSIELNN